MALLLENISQIVTCSTNGKSYKACREQSDVGLINNASLYCRNGKIEWIGKTLINDIRKKNLKKIDCRKKVVMPGFIDSHTHIVFAGDRADEFGMRMRGMTYEQIAASGGGIVKTVDAVRNSSKQKLKKLAIKRIAESIKLGVTTIESKSGYGLDTKNELKILEVINELRNEVPIDVCSTLLGAHAFPGDVSRKDYIDMIKYEMIPLVAKKRLADFIDVFCEKNYYTPEETTDILQEGIKFGLIPKLHTNQFHSIGGIRTAIENKAVTVEHLEVMTDKEINELSGTGIIACVLPTVSYFLDIPYAPARKMIEKNIPVALATDFNPGSSMTQNIQLVMSMAVQLMKMNIEEAINAVTINAAAALCIQDKTGSIEIGKDADLLIFDMEKYENIVYHFGVNHISHVIKRGELISSIN